MAFLNYVAISHNFFLKKVPFHPLDARRFATLKFNFARELGRERSERIRRHAALYEEDGFVYISRF